jgi:hypothetical protein
MGLDQTATPVHVRLRFAPSCTTPYPVLLPAIMSSRPAVGVRGIAALRMCRYPMRMAIRDIKKGTRIGLAAFIVIVLLGILLDSSETNGASGNAGELFSEEQLAALATIADKPGYSDWELLAELTESAARDWKADDSQHQALERLLDDYKASDLTRRPAELLREVASGTRKPRRGESQDEAIQVLSERVRNALGRRILTTLVLRGAPKLGSSFRAFEDFASNRGWKNSSSSDSSTSADFVTVSRRGDAVHDRKSTVGITAEVGDDLSPFEYRIHAAQLPFKATDYAMKGGGEEAMNESQRKAASDAVLLFDEVLPWLPMALARLLPEGGAAIGEEIGRLASLGTEELLSEEQFLESPFALHYLHEAGDLNCFVTVAYGSLFLTIHHRRLSDMKSAFTAWPTD